MNAVSFLLVLSIAAWGSAGTGPAPVFAPDGAFPDAPEIRGVTFHRATPSWAVELRRVDTHERQAYLERVTGLLTDPFASSPGEPAGFLSFLLHIENRGETAMIFNPAGCWLTTNREEHLSPLGLADLSFLYRLVGRDLPAAYERVGPALFERPRSVAPGESVSGLLVYRSVKPKTKSFRVDVPLSLSSGEAARFTAPYRRVKSGH